MNKRVHTANELAERHTELTRILSKLNSRIDELLPELYAANKRGASLKALAKNYKIEGTDSLAVQVSSLSHKIRERGRLVLDAYKAERERQRNSNRLANRFHGVRRNFGSIPSLDIFLDIEAGMSPEATAEKHRVICIIVNRVCEAFSNFEHAKQYKRLDPGSDVCVGFNARPLSGPDLSVDIEILHRRRSGADLQKLSEIFCVSARAIELKLQKVEKVERDLLDRHQSMYRWVRKGFHINRGDLDTVEYWSAFWGTRIMHNQNYICSAKYFDEIFVIVICPVGRWRGEKRAIPVSRRIASHSAKFFDENSLPVCEN